MSVQSQESGGQEKCMTKLGLLESYTDETEDGISLLNAQVILNIEKYSQLTQNNDSKPKACLNQSNTQTHISEIQEVMSFRRFFPGQDSLQSILSCSGGSICAPSSPEISLPREPCVLGNASPYRLISLNS